MTTTFESHLMTKVREVFEDISGLELEGFGSDSSYLELGLDSLLLTQAATSLKRTFGVEVSFRQLSDELDTPGALVRYLSEHMTPKARADHAPTPAAESAAPSPAVPPASVPVPSAGAAGAAPPAHSTPASAAPPAVFPVPGPAATGDGLTDVLVTQLNLMQQQLQALLGQPMQLRAPRTAQPDAPAQPEAPAEPRPEANPAPSPASPEPVSSPAEPATSNASQRPAESKGPANINPDGKTVKPFGAQARIERQAQKNDPETKKRLQDFVAKYVRQTSKSKEQTAAHRSVLADPRVVSGFRPDLKEITYPLVIERSRGVHLWDVDGNRYVDMVNGFGSNFFGYSPDFVREAVKRQIDQGIEIGPQSALTGRVAKKFVEMVGQERVAFCSTGSEAVLGAVRTARTITGNDDIVMFAGGYHGIFDEVVVRGTPSLRSMPAAAGIPREAVANITVLDYDSEDSLRIIDERGPGLAAVLVEPVQSRRPELQPRDFLHRVREITAKHGVAMIMDEVVTGFRIAPRGSQEWFGIDADIGTYGKAFGGGLPIGAIAGKRRFMDALDGGTFAYGDDSIPEVGVTYFAGTFVRHPLALAAAEACLDHMASAGPELQRGLNARSDAFVERLKAAFARVEAPIYLRNFGSLMKLDVTSDSPFGGLFFHCARLRGVHILEGRPIFLTLAHTDEDLDLVEKALVGAVLDMQELGFFPQPQLKAAASEAPPTPNARLGRDVDGTPAWFAPDPNRPGKFVRVARVR